MTEARTKLKQIKKAIIESHTESFDFEMIKEIFLFWLSQFHYPNFETDSNWEEHLDSFPDPSPDCIKPSSGLKLRFLLKLYTTHHRYIISIIECFDSDAKGIGILSVHVNMDQTEYNLQKSVELTYKHSFDNSLKPKQTIWAENFNEVTFKETLNNAGLAILGNELQGSIEEDVQIKIKHDIPKQVNFPDSEE